jgi:ubiquinone/menaquinone biosynthesis C-methylase UbiE
MNHYNKLDEGFLNNHKQGNKYSNQIFYQYAIPLISQKVVFDLGCGDGTDMELYTQYAKKVQGCDISKKCISKVRQKGFSDVLVADMNSLPVENNTYDVVLSKYAIQCSESIDEVYKEVYRVLKKEGSWLFMVPHPLRSFLEKKMADANYFTKDKVVSNLFSNQFSVEELSHTMQEYLSNDFFSLFELELLIERDDFHSAEKIEDMNYPTLLLIQAKKK